MSEELDETQDEPKKGVSGEMETVIVGPPGYGSPDEKTNAARLTTLDDHIRKDELDAAYGQDVTPEQIEEAKPLTPEELSGQVAATEAKSEVTATGDYDSMTKAELVEIARDRDIEGYSSMNKDELVAALEEQDSEG